MERAVERSVIVDLGVKKLSTHQSDITVFSYFCNCKSSEQMVGHQGFGYDDPNPTLIQLQLVAFNMDQTSTSKFGLSSAKN